MSVTRPSTSLFRLTQSLGQRYASTAAPASSYPRKTSTPVRKAPAPSTPSRASISSTPTAAAAANDLPPPPPSFEDIAGPARPAASSSKFSRPAPGQSPPAPLTTFPDENYTGLPNVEGADWSTSFAGLSTQPFDDKAAAILLKPVTPEEIEVKPDGILYMPEIRYRRRLNQAFGPGGWGLAPRGGSHITDRQVTREWGLVCLGRLVAVARGESEYFDQTGIANAHEAAKSNALMRCCKDLGIADSLWDPTFIRKFKAEHVAEVWVAHSTKGNKKKMFRKKTDPKFSGAWKE